ncbi:MAG: alanine racemase [Acidimicrobiales bacterium]
MPLTRPRLTIRLDAVADNYRHLVDVAAGAAVGAAVKADAYGLGLVPVVSRLWDVGCREFFVASVEEGIALRAALPDAVVNVFNGAMPGTEGDLIAHRLVPLVISGDQLAGWRTASAAHGTALPVGLHVDTGINRTGLTPVEVDAVAADPSALDGLELRHVLSHLASADDPESPQSEEQLARFREVRRRFPGGVASLANSAGTFRDPSFHLDLVRPGVALYGGWPIAGRPSPLRQTVVLEAPVMQLRDVGVGDRVGYGATYEVTKPERHAVVPVGYADGFHRAASNRAIAHVAGVAAPIVGRVSMDLIVVDVTGLPVEPGDAVELIGDHCPIDEVATAAGTISYELLTSLGPRYERLYTG